MNRVAAALIMVIGGLAVYWLTKPYITVYQIKDSAENNNAAALSEYIDLPSVRQSVKEQLTASLAKVGVEDNAIIKDNPFADLAELLGATMADSMVDAYVTPASIASLLAGKAPNGISFDTSYAYESLHKFTVSTTYGGVDTGRQLTLSRQGLFGWKITDIRIPLD